MPTLDFAPDEDAYSFSEPDDFLYVATAGGFPRTRADIINSNKIVGVQWTCSAAMYDYLCAFNAANIVNDSEPFNVPLFIDEVETKLYVCRFVPESFKLVQQEGETYTVSAALEVEVRGFALEELDDGTTSNAGVGGGGAGYYPGSTFISDSAYTLWDRWGFETGTLELPGQNGNVITLYDDADAQSASSDYAQGLGERSLRKSGGLPIEMTPAIPVKPKWEIEFYCLFPSVISGFSGDDGGTFSMFALDSVVPIPTGSWNKVVFRYTDTDLEFRFNDVLIASKTRDELGVPSTFDFGWQIGHGGYDYYYGSYWYIDNLAFSYVD
jgi:hypothetical protein